MGEISDMMMEGILCCDCGGFLGERIIMENGGSFNGKEIVRRPGMPLLCEDCKDEDKGEDV